MNHNHSFGMTERTVAMFIGLILLVALFDGPTLLYPALLFGLIWEIYHSDDYRPRRQQVRR